MKKEVNSYKMAGRVWRYAKEINADLPRHIIRNDTGMSRRDNVRLKRLNKISKRDNLSPEYTSFLKTVLNIK